MEKGRQGFRSRRRGGMRDKIWGGGMVTAKGSEVLGRTMGRVGRKCELFERRIRGAESPGGWLGLERGLWNALAGRRG